ncbi:DUF4082 domain-containing protein [Microbacterium sp. Sa4CUA7]|uniref:DUF4082 domain-containing protein n=1 Tax=Microbacterium pullorum TaxID=2762236 RepID=A0ABR8S529_9MICO|nr:DUF4082 domain-containing protein [Microbacterium pullorum]MBD7958560.1 DUF4082 domain-containing protein [Microbacterium pullorum]
MGNLGTAVAWTAEPSSRAPRRVAAIVIVALLAAALVALQPSARAEASSPCGAGVNRVVCENQQGGTDPEVWDIDGAGDPTIQGFATDISVNAGSPIDFKIDTDAADYKIDIYRTGWYQGKGARFIQPVTPSHIAPQVNECKSDELTELYDCGTWDVSATWNVPADAASGVYIARLERTDTHGASHIIFIVRRDGNTSDVLFQTSDPTWHAYNGYGGSDFYQGADNGRAYKVSYNRPFATREGVTSRDFYFSSEYATVRFLERNGYDVSYIAGVDTDRRGGELLNHDVFLSVGHDEYWSGAQRANIEAARDAGVNLQFLTGNEGYWRTRYEPSIDDSRTAHRTLVSYKETWSNAKIDPSQEWTGTWRDPRFATAAQGGHLPENAVTGTMYFANHNDLPVTVTAEQGKLRMWRGTALSELPAGAAAELAPHTVGYESNEVLDNGFSPPGLIRLSTTVGQTPQYLSDYGNTVVAGTTEHHTTLYRAAGGALVFSAGSVQWSWGLDETHDGDGAPADVRMQQAQVNLLADMGAQPGSLMAGLVPASPSTDTTPPTTVILTPAAGQQITHGSTVTVTGTAADAAGVVAAVEVSTDGGTSWHAADGTTSWSYTYLQQGNVQAEIRARAVDDSVNFSSVGTRRTIVISGAASSLGDAVPRVVSADDSQAVELGLRFTPSVDGFVSGVRFFKGPTNTGIHLGRLWSGDGHELGRVEFGDETATGWQTARFDAPVAVTAGTGYVVSYSAPQGGYSFDAAYWPYRARPSVPVGVIPGVGEASPGVFGHVGQFPAQAWGEANYYVDAIFEVDPHITVRVSDRDPSPDLSSVPPTSPVAVTFTGDVQAGSVEISIAGPDGDPLGGTVSYDAAQRRALFVADAPLAQSTTYSVSVDAAVAGNASFDPGQPWTFTTSDPLVPEGQCPCSLYTSLDAPQIASAGDSSSVTLGVRFAVNRPGAVTGVRFYKGPSNAGPRKGALWTTDGRRIAEVSFATESAGGWQSAEFTQPVPVASGTEYIVSYEAPVGGYSVTPAAYAAGYSRGPLSVPAGGAVFSYSGGFPSQSSSSSYYVEPVFQPEAAGPAVVATSPDTGSTGVARNVEVSTTFGEVLTAVPEVHVDAAGQPVSGTTRLDAAGTTVIFTPSSLLPYGTQVAVRVSGHGSSGVQTELDFGFRVETDPTVPAPYSFFGATPTAPSASDDGRPVELGMVFATSESGVVSALRFYKPEGDTGAHTGTLWSPTGVALASVLFEDESASGWQRASLVTPVALLVGQPYTVSYQSPLGRYVSESGYFTIARTSGPLTAATAGNGVYRYGTAGQRPTETWGATNYFVDVEFVAAAPPSGPVAVQAKEPVGDGVGLSQPITATLTPGAQLPTLSVSGGGAVVTGTSGFDPVTRRVTFTPAMPLIAATTYTVRVLVAGETLGQWSFTTADAGTDGPVGSAPVETMFGDATPTHAAWDDTAATQVATRFQVRAEGAATGVRFYKGAANVGAHTGYLWGGDHRLLAEVQFADETPEGWQTAQFAAPVELQPGVEYRVGLHSTEGRYSVDVGMLAGQTTVGGFAIPADGGAHTYSRGFPVSLSPHNYWVDVTFVPSG